MMQILSSPSLSVKYELQTLITHLKETLTFHKLPLLLQRLDKIIGMCLFDLNKRSTSYILTRQ